MGFTFLPRKDCDFSPEKCEAPGRNVRPGEKCEALGEKVKPPGEKFEVLGRM